MHVSELVEDWCFDADRKVLRRISKRTMEEPWIRTMQRLFYPIMCVFGMPGEFLCFFPIREKVKPI